MITHPAKFNEQILKTIEPYIRYKKKVLDPFAGTGKIKDICPHAICLEIELEWAAMRGGIVGDAIRLPFKEKTFDAIVTSPVYGNRLSDHHEAKDKSKRYTYRHCLGRKLDENNSGKMQWGLEYRKFHIDAWAEVFSVLKRGGLFILNISDHVRKGEIMPVSEWHKKIIIDIGFTFVEEYRIETPRMRYGENYRARVGYENLFIFKK
jgi:DNA modification methylase